MTDRELHKLRRQDLLQLLLMQSKEVSQLQAALEKEEASLSELREDNERLKRQLDEANETASRLNQQLEEKDAHILRLNIRVTQRLDQRLGEIEALIRALDLRREPTDGELPGSCALAEELWEGVPAPVPLTGEPNDGPAPVLATEEEAEETASPPEEEVPSPSPAEACDPRTDSGEEARKPKQSEIPPAPRSSPKNDGASPLPRPAPPAPRQGQNS